MELLSRADTFDSKIVNRSQESKFLGFGVANVNIYEQPLNIT